MKKNTREETKSKRGYQRNSDDTAFDIITKYGTYNIQPTADTENPYPKIAQGLPKEKSERKKH